MSLKYLITTWTQILTGRGAIPCKSCPKSRANSLSFKGLWIQTRRAQEEPQLIRANTEVSHRAFLSLRDAGGQTGATHRLFLTRKPRGLTLTVRVSAALLPVPRDELAPLLEVTRETGSGIARENHSQVFEPKLHHSQQCIPCCYRVHPRQAGQLSRAASSGGQPIAGPQQPHGPGHSLRKLFPSLTRGRLVSHSCCTHNRAWHSTC